MKNFLPILIAFILFSLLSCQKAEGPNSLGGDPKTGFTNVGDTTSVHFGLQQIGLGNDYLSVDFVVKENNNGIVTSVGKFRTDTAFTHKLDTVLGTATLPPQFKEAIRNRLIKAFNVKIDSSDKNNIKMEFEIKSKVTSEGIQDFAHSNGNTSKPFTLVKYSAKVGDKYEFTDDDGNKFVREVTYRSTTDDYDLIFWRIKVIKVEETVVEGPYKDIFGKITYYTNHKFGLVGVEWTTYEGKVLGFMIWPPNL
jgi:hypothetical protein